MPGPGADSAGRAPDSGAGDPRRRAALPGSAAVRAEARDLPGLGRLLLCTDRGRDDLPPGRLGQARGGEAGWDECEEEAGLTISSISPAARASSFRSAGGSASSAAA